MLPICSLSFHTDQLDTYNDNLEKHIHCLSLPRDLFPRVQDVAPCLSFQTSILKLLPQSRKMLLVSSSIHSGMVPQILSICLFPCDSAHTFGNASFMEEDISPITDPPQGIRFLGDMIMVPSLGFPTYYGKRF